MTGAPGHANWWGSHLLDADDDSVVFRHGGGGVTRAEVHRRMEEAASLLAASGIGPGATVALQVSPSYTYVHALLALWRSGAQVLLLDHRLKRAEVDRLLEACRSQFYIHSTDPARTPATFRAERELIIEVRRSGRRAETDHCLVQVSSGTTGTPKVIGRTAGSLLAEIDRFARIEGMPGRGDRLLLLSSVAHTFGLVGGILHALARGVAVVFAGPPAARDLVELANREQVDTIFGAPFHYDLLSALPDPPVPAGLRIAVSGGEVLPDRVAARFEQRYGVRVGDAYGMTEVGIIAADLTGRHRPAVGPPAPGIQVKVDHGELYVAVDRSPYLRSDGPDRFRDGWLRTFDLAEYGDGGLVSVRGRSDSLVVVGGLKVDLTEIETALCEHPDITEAVVIHAGGIEAYVGSDADPSVDEIVIWCRDRLADYKIPKRFHVARALPRAVSGKLIRSHDALRQAHFAAAAPLTRARLHGAQP
ncbi:class I adenylate-forming enzyme family protein [Micromonospora sp. KC721]|uniref:class I adenylate-forming enzyme family protein n=1 Tax=Micromonospora sp. KC721 TaxID=2530380 RepID=UPI0014052E13|nr:class I adenylate-forming enzyme family protein [Micromonospora sp. KC721]